jgi:hercynylcysteine S-oxide lyase
MSFEFHDSLQELGANVAICTQSDGFLSLAAAPSSTLLCATNTSSAPPSRPRTASSLCQSKTHFNSPSTFITTNPPTHPLTLPPPRPNTNPIPNPLPPSSNSPYITNFQFVGTIDNTPYFCLPAALSFRASVLGGEAAIMRYCHGLARDGGARVAALLGTEVLDNAQGTLGAGTCFSNVALPLRIEEAVAAVRARGVAVGGGGSEAEEAAVGKMVRDWVCDMSQREHATFFAVIFYARRWWVRLSAQVYLDMADFEWSARVLADLCERARAGDFVPQSRARL